jgi:HSP20 family protein
MEINANPKQGGDLSMVISRRSPLPQLSTLPSLFNGRNLFEGWSWPDRLSAPLDVQRTDEGYRIEAALPGFRPDDIEITLEQGTLTISAKRSEEKKTERGQYLHREVYSGSFIRRVVLPSEIKAEDISTSFEDGMLTVDVKYDSRATAVKIPVGAAETQELPSSTT